MACPPSCKNNPAGTLAYSPYTDIAQACFVALVNCRPMLTLEYRLPSYRDGHTGATK